MKEIKVMVTDTVIVTDKVTSLKDAIDIIQKVKINKAKVIDEVLAIEKGLVSVIRHYFFDENIEKGKEFVATILNSDWCTFSSKRKLIFHINDKGNYFKGTEKKEFKRLLHKAMSYRNAFAHGDIQSDAYKAYLVYFEGKQIKKDLTDKYWGKLEAELNKCFELVQKFQYLTGAIKEPKEIKERGEK